MNKLLPGLLALLLLSPLATQCEAQVAARAPKEEQPLAAAFRLARGLEDERERESALAGLANTHRAAGRLEEAVRVTEVMDDGGLKALTLSRLANRFAEAGRLERAAELLLESLSVIRRAEDDQGFRPELLQQMVRGEQRHNFEGVSISSETVKGALAHLVEAGRVSAAADVLSQLRDFALDPDAGALDAARLLAGVSLLYAKSDETKVADVLSEALAAARRVERDDERVEALAEVGRAYAEAGDRKTAEALLDEAQQFAAPFGDYMDEEMREVARAYAAAGLTEKALKALPEPAEDVWEPTHVSFQAKAAAAAGRPEALRESLTRALARVASFEGYSTASHALSDLAAIYGKLSPELLSEVLGAARALENESARAAALAAVGDRYAEAGRKEAALDAWRQVYEAARAVVLDKSDYEQSSSRRGDAGKLRLLTALAFKLIHAGEHSRAPEFARDMRAVQADTLLLIRGSTGCVHEADAYVARLAEELLGVGQTASALTVLAEAGDPFEKPGPNIDPLMRASAVASVGSAYAKAGDRERAAVYLRRALQLADGIKDDGGQQKFWALVNIGARYEDAGLQPDARARKNLRLLVRGVEAEKQ